MTTPDERWRSVVNTREFLVELSHGDDALERARLREVAKMLLRHYPDETHLSLSAAVLPDVWRDPTTRRKW